MTSPINSDKSLSVSQDRALRTSARDAGKSRHASPAATESPEKAPPIRSQEPDIERASQLFQSENGVTDTSRQPPQTEEQARSLVERLKSQLAENPTAALAAVSNAGVRHASALLQQAPA